MKKSIVLLPGDGIGPEVTAAAASVLKECAREFHHDFQFEEHPVGGTAIDVTGTPLPNATIDACRKADAVFLGAVGGPKWDSLPVGKRPESGLLALRKGMGLYVNVRPVKLLEPLRGMSPLKPERLGDLDLDIVRELALPPVKIHCSVLAEDAIKAAIGDWKKKHGVEVPAHEKSSH